MFAWFRPPVVVALVLVLAGCGGKRDAIVLTSTPAPVVAPAPPPPAISPINRALSPAATVWHLRVALNVAALACRGPQELTIVADYNAMLAGQKAALATIQATLSSEYRARGGDWQDGYDDAMTRLYNFFSQAQARDAFCAAAAQVLADTRTLAPDALGGFAGERLALLDRPFAEAFAPPAVDRTPAAPAQVIAAAPEAMPAAPSAPHLQVSIAALGD